MKLVFFGLTISSSWGNGHATLWRGLVRALIRRGHEVVFFERDLHYYAAHRDLFAIEGGELVIYPEWGTAVPAARRHLADADAAMVTSYCPDGPEASALVLASNVPLKTFYDLDTPVTLDRLRAGEPVAYLPPQGLGEFDLVLSYTGGPALVELETRLGARLAVALYGSADPEVHQPVTPVAGYACDLSYLGTYAADRQAALERLFIEPARKLSGRRFVLGGAQYPVDFPWFPEDGLSALPEHVLSFLLFPVERPELFDSVLTDEPDGGDGAEAMAPLAVRQIQVKQPRPASHWIWGAFKMPGAVFHALHALWREPERGDEYIGTLVNAYLARGGSALAVRAGEAYVDVGTLNGYRQAIGLLAERPPPADDSACALEPKRRGARADAPATFVPESVRPRDRNPIATAGERP